MLVWKLLENKCLINNMPETESLYFIHKFPSSSKKYNPYTLQSSSYEKINHNNFFLVEKGEIHHCLNGKVESMQFSKWEGEKNNYHKLRQVTFFNSFLQRKAFLKWKKWVRKRKFRENAMKLNCSLFVINEILGIKLRYIHEMCSLIANTNLVVPQVSIDLEEIGTIQREHLYSIKIKLTDFHQLIVEQTLIACTNSLRKCGFTDDGMGAKESTYAKSFTNTDKMQGFNGNPYSKTDHCHEALKKIHYKMLVRYIELVQYVTYEALYRVMINTIAELTKQAKHLIEDQLDLDSCHTKKGNHWDSAERYVESMGRMMEDIAHSCHDTINSFRSITTDKALQPITRPMIKNKRMKLTTFSMSLPQLINNKEYEEKMMELKVAIHL